MGSESRHDHGNEGSTNRPDILRRLPGIRQFISLLSFEIHQHNLGCPFPAVSVLSIYSLHKIPTVMIESADKLHAIHFEVFGTRPDSDLDAVWPSSSVTRHTCTWSRNFFVLDIIVATENELSEQVIISLLTQSARSYKVHSRLRKQGFGYLKEKVHSLNELAERIPLILLIDLDQSECLVEFKREWLPVHQSPSQLFRIAVREVESRLLADRTALAQFLRISEEKIPREPDKLPYPKQSLLGLFKCLQNGLCVRTFFPKHIAPLWLVWVTTMSCVVSLQNTGRRNGLSCILPV